MFHKRLCCVPFLRLQVLLMKQLPVEQIPGHEVRRLPGEAAGTVDQHQGGEAADQEGTQLHGPGVDVVELWRHDAQRR